ncbi:hypothetical protein OQA88_7965 [Cercophora sp. LCS_1]
MDQLAAKCHELFIVASLAAITVKIFQRLLVQSHLPIGLLSSAYRVGDVPHLISGSFWGTVAARKGRAYVLALLVAVNTLMATLVGPASAILMVPELDWVTLTGGGFPEIWNWVKGWEISALTNEIELSEPTGTTHRRVVSSSPVEFADGGNVTYTTTVSMSSMLTVGRLLNYLQYGYVDVGTLSGEPKFRLQTSQDSPMYQPVVQTRCTAYERENLEADDPPNFYYGSIECFGDENCEQAKAQAPLPIPLMVLNGTGIEPVVALSAPNSSTSQPLLAAISLPYLDLNTTSEEREVKVLTFACVIAAHWAQSTLTISPRGTKLLVSNITGPAAFFDANSSSKIRGSMGSAITPTSLRSALSALIKAAMTTKPLSDNNILNPDNKITNTSSMPLAVFNPGSATDSFSGRGADRAFTQYILQKVLGTVVADGLARAASNGTSHGVFPEPANANAIRISNIGAAHGLENHEFVFGFSGAGSGFSGSGEPSGGIAVAKTATVTTEDELREILAQQTTQFIFSAERFGYCSRKRTPTLDFASYVMYIYLGMVGVCFVYLVVWECVSRFFGVSKGVLAVAAWDSLETLILLVWNSKPRPDVFGLPEQRGKGWNALGERDVAIRADNTGKVGMYLVDNGARRVQGVVKLMKGKKYV